MSILNLILISVAGTAGVMYIYVGKLRDDRAFLYAGLALVACLFLVTDPRLLVLIGAVLAVVPFVVHRFTRKKRLENFHRPERAAEPEVPAAPRPERPPLPQRPERPERYDRQGRPERFRRSRRPERAGRPGRPGR